MPSSTPTTSSEGFNEIHAPSSSSQKLVYFSNEFPHDDLPRLLRLVTRHSKTRNHGILAVFLHEATLAVREEISLLPVTLKALVPPFESVLNLADFADLRRGGPLCESINGVLLCVVQISAFIGHHEAYPASGGLDSDTITLAGLGIGLLATAAVALARHLSDVPLVGAQVIRQAFRLGVLVDEVSTNLHPRDATEAGTPDSWAYVLPDVTVEDVQHELDSIHAKEKTPVASKIFISALNASSVTISGPPSRLKALFRVSDFFRDRRSLPLPVYGGLCHAQHIYNESHVQGVTETPSMGALDRFEPHIPVYSTGSGRPFPARTARGLFECIVEEILTQTIRWDSVTQGLVQMVQASGAARCEVLVFRTSLPVQDLLRALKKLSHIETTTSDLIPWIHEPVLESPRGTAQSKIAIVGMSCRLPGGATSTDKLWELLEGGLDVHRKIPADRFDVDSHWDPTGKRVNTSHTPYGCFIDEPGLFDAPFFNMSPREAQQTDPMQRLAIVTAYEALERAGYVANRTAATKLERIGTFYGQASDDYREVNTAQEISTYFIPGGCRAFGPGRINYFFKFSGPSYSIDSACSSSLATIQSACTALWNGELDTAVVGGMNVLTNSDAFAGLSHGHFLSKTPNACKTWDSEADGYCRADGVASLVMKRLEDAEADRDNILGVVLGAATNHSANAVSITHPHAGHQAYLGRLMLNRAGIDPLDVGYVEMHGTGTQAGDAEEIQSVTSVFAPARRTPKNPVYIGAVKANVGHGEAVAGVTALIKVLLMLQNNAIPPHVGIKNSLNPKFPKDMETGVVRIPFGRVEWPRGDKKRMAMVNNFSAAGGNTSVVLEDGPVVDVQGTDPRPTHVVGVSAKSKISLRGNLERLLAYVEGAQPQLSHLAYTTTARRHHHNHRVAFAASDLAQVQKHLKTALDSVDTHKPISSSHGPPPVAFIFTGQGASFKSYSLELYHECPSFRTHVRNLDGLAQGQGFPSFVPVLDGSHAQDHGHSTVLSQLAQVCVQMALVKYWASLGVRPDAVVGHSLGEYPALYAAGVLSASDVIFLVGQRARLLEQKCEAGSYKMVAVRASLGQIERTLSDSSTPWEVACLNGPKETVLSGPVENMNAVSSVLEADGYKCHSLDVPFAFHSAQTDPVLDEFEALAASGVVFQAPHVPVISPLLNRVIFDDKSVNASYVRRAMRETVNMLDALHTAQKIHTVDEDTVWIEMGPHPVCAGFVRNTLHPGTAVPSLRRGENNWTTLANSLATLHGVGVEIEWSQFHGPFEMSLRLLDLPTYAWNDKTYWLQYQGDWALTKGNTFYDEEKGLGAFARRAAADSFGSSTVQHILEERFDGNSGTVVMQSDLSQRDFRAAAWGHKMNGCGVVTSSIHADIAYTLGEYLYKRLRPNVKPKAINISNLEVLKGLVANQDSHTPQLIQVHISTDDISSDKATLTWYNVCSPDEPFASATLVYGDASSWLLSWTPLSHLITSRIQALSALALSGAANRLNHTMAYQLFAANLVDYASVYRGMQSVVLHGLEAFAEVTLTTEFHGSFTVPPHFIDSVAHLAGFIMNVSDALDTAAKFAVTPGWRSMQLAKPLVGGAKFQSYVKMIPEQGDEGLYFGDVYVLQDDEIVGMVGGIQFRRYPRILLSRFFSAPDDTKAPPVATALAKGTVPKKSVATSKPVEQPIMAAPVKPAPAPVVEVKAAVEKTQESAPAMEPSPATEPTGPSSTTVQAIQLIATEAALDLADLTDDAGFAELGVDSLMSLVIAEKFREQLGVVVNGSLFLEYPTIGDLRSWLDEYYS